MDILQACDLKKTYGTGEACVHALDGVSLNASWDKTCIKISVVKYKDVFPVSFEFFSTSSINFATIRFAAAVSFRSRGISIPFTRYFIDK